MIYRHAGLRPLRVSVEIMPQGCGHGARPPAAYGPAIDAHHRHDDLACGRHEGFAGRVGFRNAEGALFEYETLGLEGVD